MAVPLRAGSYGSSLHAAQRCCLLLSLLLVACGAPAAALGTVEMPLGQPWLIEPALGIAVKEVLRVVVLTPRLSEDDAAASAAAENDIVAANARAAAAQRLNTAQGAAATLLADDTLARVLGDTAVMRTLRRLRAERGGNASATAGTVNSFNKLSRSQPPVLDSNRSSRRRAAARMRSSSDGGLQSRARFRTTGPPDMVAAAVARPSSARKRLQVDASGGGADVVVCPAAGDAASSLLGSPTEHRQLDFTGGYSSSAHCVWDIRCEHGQVVALHFTALDTEADWDFVSLATRYPTPPPGPSVSVSLDSSPMVAARVPVSPAAIASVAMEPCRPQMPVAANALKAATTRRHSAHCFALQETGLIQQRVAI